VLLRDMIDSALRDAQVRATHTTALLLVAPTHNATPVQQVAHTWSAGGPVFAAADADTWAALDAARRLLAAELVDTVVLGAAQPAAGACAVVLQRHAYAQQAGTTKVYATLEALALAPQTSEAQSRAAAVAQASQQAWHAAGIPATSVGYLEIADQAIASADRSLLDGLRQVYRVSAKAESGSMPACAVGSAEQVDLPLLSLIRTALCLYQRAIPAVPGWAGPDEPEAWQHSPFYVAPEPHPWLLEQHTARRVAAVSGTSTGDMYAHLVLSEDPRSHERSTAYLAQTPPYLYPIAADDLDGLMSQLDALERLLAQTTLVDAARQCYELLQSNQHARYGLALVANSQDELQREIRRAREGVVEAFEKGGEWKTPGGSYATARPLGPQGAVAFVYPGAFTAYIGLGQHLFQQFPMLHEGLESFTSAPARSVGERLLYPRSIEPPSAEHIKALETQLAEESIAMLEIGTSFAKLYTMIMRDCFGVQPQMAFGYSQGETTMMHALGVWIDSEEASRKLHASDLYKTRLSGPKLTVREFWGIHDTDNAADLWANYIVLAPAEQVIAQVEDEPHVYLAIVNSPREVMIAGDPAGCQRVISRVKGRSLRAPFKHVIHSPPVQLEYDRFVQLNLADVHSVSGIRFYSAASYAPIQLTSDTIAHSIARVFCQPFDFPRLVQQVYDDGARIFVELGPARNCSHWIDNILKGQDYCALSINKKGADDHASVVRVLAQLFSHRVALDLGPLYGQPVTAPVFQSHHAVHNGIHPPEQPCKHAGNGHGHGRPAAAAHMAFLRSRQESLRHLDQTIQQHISDLRASLAHDAMTPDAPELATPTPTATQPELPATALAAPATQTPAATVTEAPPEPDASRRVLIDEQQIQEFTLGSVAACFGPEYHIYDHKRTPRTPNGDLQMMSRVIEVQGTRHEFTPGTLIISEYDVPADAWYYEQNAYPTLPYSLLMEMALQPCGFLSAYLGSSLLFPDTDLYFRNLDGRGRTHGMVDLRGKTVTHHAKLLSSTFIQGIIIQKYTFQMWCADELFYEGDSVFGYFTPEALTNQIGLDNGKTSRPWYQQSGQTDLRATMHNLRSLAARQRLYIAPEHKPAYHLAHDQLDVLDQVMIVEGGGHHQQGYVYANKRVNPDDWFFACHFKDDPVMPGSLGVEGIIQAMQAYALHMDLGKQFDAPHFEYQPDHETSWKYRGQIPRKPQTWSLEVHITRVDSRADQVVIYGDASVWREQLRIYEIKQIAIRLVDTHTKEE
jgi:PfaB family protein